MEHTDMGIDDGGDHVGLSPVHASGVHRVRAPTYSVGFLDDHTIIYPLGRHIVAYNTQTREQAFLTNSFRDKRSSTAEKKEDPQLAARTERVHFLVLSRSCTFVAALEELEEAESPSSLPVIAIYRLCGLSSLTRVFVLAEASVRYVTMAFASDGKYLAVQAGEPDWVLYYWNWERKKVLASTRLSAPVTRVLVNPWNAMEIVVLSPKMLRFAQFTTNNNLRTRTIETQKKEHELYTDAVWLSEKRLVVTTDGGCAFIIGEMGRVVHLETVHPDGLAITSVQPLKDGFLAAGLRGFIGAFRPSLKGAGSEMYELRHGFYGEDHDIILSMNLNVSGNRAVCLFEPTAIALFPLDDLPALTADGNHFLFQDITDHTGEITGFDSCAQKPLLVTCSSEDGRLVIFDHLEMRTVMKQTCPSPPRSVAIHPLGFHLLVAFEDKVVLYIILRKGLFEVREFRQPDVSQVRFSFGGHVFGLRSGDTIRIYSMSCFTCLGMLKDERSIPFMDFFFSPDDTNLGTINEEGIVSEFSVGTMCPLRSYSLENVRYLSATYIQGNSMLLASSNDNLLRILFKGEIHTEVPSEEAIITHVAITSGGNGLICGTSDGTVRTCMLPLSSTPVFLETSVFQGPVTAMGISQDDTHLFVCSREGYVLTFSIQVVMDGVNIIPKSTLCAMNRELTVVTQTELRANDDSIQSLNAKIKDVEMHADYRLMLKDNYYAGQIEKLKAENAGRVEGLETDLTRSTQQHDHELQEAIARLEQEHLWAAEELDGLYRKRTALEANRTEVLRHKLEDTVDQYEERIKKVEKQCDERMDQFERDQDDRVVEWRSAYNTLQDELKGMKMSYESQLQQQEGDHEKQMRELKAVCTREVKEELEQRVIEATSQLKSQKDTILKQLDDRLNELQQKKNEIAELQNDLENRDTTIRTLAHDKSMLEATVIDKDKRIFELKAKIRELDKYKFVIDYKFKGLKELLGPKEDLIQNMTEQMSVLNTEVERNHRRRQQLEDSLRKRHNIIETMHKEMERTRQLVMDRTRLSTSILHDLSLLLKEASPEGATWMLNISNVVRKYEKVISRGTMDQGLEEGAELVRQRAYLERERETISRISARQSGMQSTLQDAHAAENGILLRELNNLRRENRALVARLMNYERCGTVSPTPTRHPRRAHTAAPSRTSSSSSPSPALRPREGENRPKTAAVGRRSFPSTSSVAVHWRVREAKSGHAPPILGGDEKTPSRASSGSSVRRPTTSFHPSPPLSDESMRQSSDPSLESGVAKVSELINTLEEEEDTLLPQLRDEIRHLTNELDNWNDV